MVVFRDPCTMCPYLPITVADDSHPVGNTLASGSDMPVAEFWGPDTSQGGPSACRMNFGPHVPGLIRVNAYTGVSRLSAGSATPLRTRDPPRPNPGDLRPNSA
jgi:hypothetical protein